ncbi:chloride channel protein [Limibaculum sp. M0105]|uniref:Chloride channel protein n=2 Tax=Thermohalobaculum xanthum TaxID=2753746 RepID=A0A8J7M7F0_9RHOB|nr:chloride channel protein [Thermohalobaculum xanthum]
MPNSESPVARLFTPIRLRLWARLRLLRVRLKQIEPTNQIVLWLIAIVVGVVTGHAITLFRAAIPFLQTIFYGTTDEMIHTVAGALPWYLVLLIPVLGGLIVGVILTRFTPDGKARGVADVIHAAALGGGRVNRRVGIGSALAALVTLSTGGSTGREGPAVHIGAVIASWVSDRLKAPDVAARDILGCAAAAAVSASFNAPIAGALFALEVVLRHYALHAFGPIVIASVAGAVVSRIHHGNVTEYALPVHTLGFYQEMPAFLLLGVVCGLTAVVMMRTIFFAEGIGDRVQRLLHIPRWLRPAVAGFVLGLIALEFPHIIGVGYETTTLALKSELALTTAVIFAVVKVIAVAATFSGHMGGGIFSPALMLGALTGTAFGSIAIDVFPSVAGSQGLYALAGTGAVAAAVLGAPISSTLIVFELTGDWQAGIAVMVAISSASVVADRLVARSFFLTQLERDGLKLAYGPQDYLARTLKVTHVMRLRGAENGASDSACWELHRQGAYLRRNDTLEHALPLLERVKGSFLPVVDEPAEEGGEPELLGAVFHVDALRAYSRCLEDELREEHG